MSALARLLLTHKTLSKSDSTSKHVLVLINPEYAGDFAALDSINKKRYAGTVTLLSKTAALGPGSPGVTLYPKFLTPDLESSKILANSRVKEVCTGTRLSDSFALSFE